MAANSEAAKIRLGATVANHHNSNRAFRDVEGRIFLKLLTRIPDTSGRLPGTPAAIVYFSRHLAGVTGATQN